MDIERKEPTKAFEKYIDSIFIIQNGLMFVTNVMCMFLLRNKIERP